MSNMPYLRAFRVPQPMGRTHGSFYDIGDGTYEFGFSDRLGFLMEENTLEKRGAANKERAVGLRGTLFIKPAEEGSGTIEVELRTVFGNTYSGFVSYAPHERDGVACTLFRIADDALVTKLYENKWFGKLVSNSGDDLARFKGAARKVLFDNYDELRKTLPPGIFIEDCCF